YAHWVVPLIKRHPWYASSDSTKEEQQTLASVFTAIPATNASSKSSVEPLHSLLQIIHDLFSVRRYIIDILPSHIAKILSCYSAQSHQEKFGNKVRKPSVTHASS